MKDKKELETKIENLKIFLSFNSKLLKEAKYLFGSSINKYRIRNVRESWELEFNNLTRKWEILLIDSIISYQIQHEEKKQPKN